VLHTHWVHKVKGNNLENRNWIIYSFKTESGKYKVLKSEENKSRGTVCASSAGLCISVCEHYRLPVSATTSVQYWVSPYIMCLAMLSTSCLCSSDTISVPYKDALDGNECSIFFGLVSPLGIIREGESSPPPLSGKDVWNLLLLQAWNDLTSSC